MFKRYNSKAVNNNVKRLQLHLRENTFNGNMQIPQVINIIVLVSD